MKQLTIISGKGGTGKTSVAAAFASLADNAVLADCDVDAADLHLILKPTVKDESVFYGLSVASIDPDVCSKCKRCIRSCRFNAISDNFVVDIDDCEGCGVCEFVCPEQAISMVERKSGFSYISDTRFGPMAHAKLNTAEEASGKLVTVVRNNASHIAEKEHRDLVIIDGPPGIGCPVIAAITGVDLVLVVTEPTLSAISDLKRILSVARHFNIPAVVCINKYDINCDNAAAIETYCAKENISVVGKLQYDTSMTQAMIHEQSIIEFEHGELSKNIDEMWRKIVRRLDV